MLKKLILKKSRYTVLFTMILFCIILNAVFMAVGLIDHEIVRTIYCGIGLSAASLASMRLKREVLNGTV